MRILDLLDRAEALLESGRRLPWGRSFVDQGQLRSLLAEIRLALPEEMKEAQRLIQERDEMISQAEQEAKRITSQAESEFRDKVKTSSVLKSAEKRAAEMVAEAERRAEEVISEAERRANARRDDADRYSLEVLRKSDAQMAALLAQVRKGIAELERSLPEA